MNPCEFLKTRFSHLKDYGSDSLLRLRSDLLSKTKLTNGETWAHLAAAGDELFVRELNALVGYRWSNVSVGSAATAR